MSKYPNRHITNPGMLTHGENGFNSPEYRSWTLMKSRCYNVSNKCYARYGGRGIKVCSRWLHSYENFLEDMGRRPSLAHTLERARVNEDYSLSNCTWATRKVQARNRSTTKHVLLGNRQVSMAEFIELGYPEEEIDLVRARIDARLRRGKSFQEATFDAHFSNNPIQGLPVDIHVA